jgi:adenylate cyclase class 1
MSSILEAQKKNNRARYGDLRSLATPEFLKVYNLAPTLLHFNHPDLPGYLDDPDTPFGLVFYDHWQEQQLEGPPFRALEEIVVDKPVVESLILIGSSGSVGHTERSDLDYWVCYNPNRLNGRQLKLFKEKLQLISKWASDVHSTEANFYPVNIAELAQGRIEHSWGNQAEGEVAPHLLMEELYRTILFVAGRYPLWCVWPLELDIAQYLQMAKSLAPLDWNGAAPQYVDLGFPTKAEPQEYLASAMWLAYKSEADPFKGILKVIPILQAIVTDFQSPLLCDLVKANIINNPSTVFAVDPYIITIDTVIEFGSKNLSPEHLELLRTAAVLKVLGLTGSSSPTQSSRSVISPSKLRVLTKWLQDWGWATERLGHLASYDSWTERERLRLGSDILMMLLGVYMRISSHLMNRFPGQVNAQDEELSPFAAKILGRQRGLEDTVDLLPSELHRQSLSKRMVFQQDILTGMWYIYNMADADQSADLTSPLENEERAVIFESERVAKAAAWLVRNKLFSEDLELTVTDSFDITTEMLKSYLIALKKNFPPVEFHNLETDTIWQVGAKGAVLVAFNLEDPNETKIRTLDVIYQTGWGEMRHQWKNLAHLTIEADKFMDLGTMLFEGCGVLSVESLVLLPEQAVAFNRAFGNLKAALMSHIRPRHQSKISKSLIDL